jgi:hypothetical protein
MVHALGDVPGASWLEPSHGKGTFVEAIACLGVAKRRIVAVDLDRTTAPADRLATTLRGTDFLRWANETNRCFDRIVGNPPFISINQLPPSLKLTASSVLDLSGQPIGKGANLWYAFVLTSLRLLRKGGCLAFVLPSAAEFTDYSAGIRQAAADTFGSLELYRCTRPLFDEVREGSLVAVARAYGFGPGLVRRRWFATRTGLVQGLSQSGWLHGHKCPNGNTLRSSTTVTLRSIAEIRLGGVTGDASFFLMNEGKRASLGLPTAALIPVVSKAKHLQSASLGKEEWHNLKALGERIWLLNPSDAMAKHSKVRRYLELKSTKGGCNRQAYKVSIRNPWYRTPMPPVPDAFLSGMSQHGPWLCINETQNVNATNTLYVVRFSSRSRRDWYMWALVLLSSEVRRQCRRIGRRYPDGLVKYEPSALANIALPQPKANADHEDLYIKALTALLGGKAALAKEIADSVLS